MDLQTWVSLVAIAGFGLAVLGSLRSFRKEFRTELKSEIGGLRTELKGDLAEVNCRLSVLEERSYDLASTLPPPPPRSLGSGAQR
jgi:hypothetical protein